VIHGVVMDTRAIRMGMIATDPTHVATHCHAADMNAATDAADVRASSETAAHVSATAETSAVTATTSASAASPRIRRADSQCGGKRGRSQDHHHSFHQDTPCI
jgi:hypothetical protein